jgi:hypothetical protein
MFNELAESLESKVYDKTKKLKDGEKIKIRKQISADFAKRHRVAEADLGLGWYWSEKRNIK